MATPLAQDRSRDDGDRKLGIYDQRGPVVGARPARCPRCGGNVLPTPDPGEYGCLQCGHVVYTAMPDLTPPPGYSRRPCLSDHEAAVRGWLVAQRITEATPVRVVALAAALHCWEPEHVRYALRQMIAAGTVVGDYEKQGPGKVGGVWRVRLAAVVAEGVRA